MGSDLHNLVSTSAETPTHSTYVCSCGAKGGATMVNHLATPEKMKQAAVKNHEMHSARAYRKTLRSREGPRTMTRHKAMLYG